MKNKKGFTLTELLVVIVLLVVVTGSTVFGIDEISKQSREKRLKELEKEISHAADIYFADNSVYSLSLLNKEIDQRCTRLYVLQNAGLLNQELINPITNKRIPANLCVNSTLNEEGVIIHEFDINNY